MRIPEFDLRCDLSECVHVVEDELEIISSSFVNKISGAVGYEFDHVYITIMSELGPPSIFATYIGVDPDNDFMCFEIELEDGEFDYILSLIATY